MLRSPRLRANPTNQRNANVCWRAGLTSTGTWYVAPPTRRPLTSTDGFKASIASKNAVNSSPSLAIFFNLSIAPYTMFSATSFLPSHITTLIHFATTKLPYLESGKISRFVAALRLDIFIFLLSLHLGPPQITHAHYMRVVNIYYFFVLAPYKERPCLRASTPLVSKTPRII